MTVFGAEGFKERTVSHKITGTNGIAEPPPVAEEAPEEVPAYLVEWKGEHIDLRGFTDFKHWQVEDRDNPALRVQHAQLVSGGSGRAVDCANADEARAFQALCGPYFGQHHP